ncbi:MAG: 4-hydroxy-tetrahydrodipicolinate reductase [Taibaiella sp.]|jgi:4-hydroxy-tetrahydrodipicolinate reductase
MKIALIGYGKMGKAIEQIALKRGHEVILRIGRGNQHEFTKENLVMADVAIEFTTPESALGNVIKCMDAGVPVICGSTGWNEHVYLAKEKCVTTNTAFLQASNFSVGVNIFFEINKRLASIMNDWPEYEVRVEETHHIEKKDAPSGTAITIAEQILENLKRKERWELDKPSRDDTVSIIAHREENVPGTHTVTYSSAIDEIEIIHTAHSREGFALGAVLAAEFIQHRKGIFSMSDVLIGGNVI